MFVWRECLGLQVLIVLTSLSFRFFRTVLQGRNRQNPFHGQASPVGVWSFLSSSSTRRAEKKNARFSKLFSKIEIEVLDAVAEQLAAGRSLVQVFGRDDAPKLRSSAAFFAGLGDAAVAAACDAVLEAAVEVRRRMNSSFLKMNHFENLWKLCARFGTISTMFDDVYLHFLRGVAKF